MKVTVVRGESKRLSVVERLEGDGKHSDVRTTG